MVKRPKTLPRAPGVYVFRRHRTPLYIGKAANLRQRLASYFRRTSDLTPKIRLMLQEATRLEIFDTESEIGALIKEAELIKAYRPKYNLLMRDDKSYFYVAITNDEFPRIFITHQPRPERIAQSGKRIERIGSGERRLFARRYQLSARYLGPFTSGTALRATLKLLRRVFPYCTCTRLHTRPCLNSEIGRCGGYCCTIAEIKNQRGKINKYRAGYLKNIRSIAAVLTGKRMRLLGRMKREMREASRRERYEEALRLRDAIAGIEDVFAHRHALHEPGSSEFIAGEGWLPWPRILGQLQPLLKTDRDFGRIEGYDISHISGREATGSMVVFTDGKPDRAQYRTFRIKTVADSNDTAMLTEVLIRRLRHPEWPYPDMMIIDGGKPQLNAALKALEEMRNEKREMRKLVVTALAKREEILFTESGRAIPLQRHDPAVLHLFQRIRDESHRFARAYHHRLRRRVYAHSA